MLLRTGSGSIRLPIGSQSPGHLPRQSTAFPPVRNLFRPPESFTRKDRWGDIKGRYQKLLRCDPENPLLLRNYGKFLDEVEGEKGKAEECYERAILAMPDDGEVLSLYGDLVWRNHRDEERAEDYFQRAVQASPNDSSVLASYAHFLWDAEEEEMS